MFPIIEADFLAPEIKRFRIEAPRIARKFQAGQFVILRIHDQGERIPLTIAEANSEDGTITLIVQGIGKTTKLLNRLEAGDALLDVVGPLGKPSEAKKFGTCVVIGGGMGTAIAYPTAVALKEAGNQVVGIIGARTKELIILEKSMEQTCDHLHVVTDDGSYGREGMVTDPLGEMIDAGAQIDHVLAIGPIPMMRAVAERTRPAGIHTIVSLNPIMVDGTGMCGGCRVQVDGRSQFACVDGPEFDAHHVDFLTLAQRNNLYRSHELAALEQFERNPEADLANVRKACRLEQQHPEVAGENNTCRHGR